MSTPEPTCKHCGGPVERVDTKDHGTVLSDSCSGCRTRYQVAEQLVEQAVEKLDSIEALLGAESTDHDGIALSDSAGRINHHLLGLRSILRNHKN